jgi:hypothetical protein
VGEFVDEEALADDGSVGEAGDRDIAPREPALQIDLPAENDPEKLAGGRFVEKIVALGPGPFFAERDEFFQLGGRDLHGGGDFLN